MRRGATALISVTLLLVVAVAAAPAQGRYPGTSWDRAPSPESLGWSTDKLRVAKEYAGTIHTAAVMIVVDGVVLDEWGETAERFNVHSIRKSFLSALYGIHVKEGRIRLGDTLADLRIDDHEQLSPIEKQATVADLLKSRSGIYHAALYESPNMAMARPARGSYPPGTFWYYNNWDFNALGTILERAAKTTIYEDFKRRIADAVEMEDFRLEDGSYVRGAESVHAAYPFRMTARDMARFGLLYLRNGRWRDRQVVPSDWIAESTRAYSNVGQAGGYGYLWWVSSGGPHLTSAFFKGEVFSAQGWGGHYILVVPYLNMVVVHRVNTGEQGRQVTNSQFGRLVQLIMNARN
jgi:CubicO group peptidase (beta-lactamase class C family)